MIKVFFQLPKVNQDIEDIYWLKLSSVFDNIPKCGDRYQILNDDCLADFVISLIDEGAAPRVPSKVLRPLSSRDVQTFVWDSSDLPTGRFSGFYCSLARGLFDKRRHTSMSYPVPFNDLIEEFPCSDATIDFSFLGTMTAGVRVRMIEQFRNSKREINAIVRESESTVWSLSEAAKRHSEVMNAKKEYVDVLRLSRFVLCPRGMGAGSFRMFETMQAGRVPVIISDSYVKPAGIDWDSCSLTIPEGSIADIPELIESRLDDWEVLASNARAVWEANFSPQNMMDFIVKNLARMSGEISRNQFSPWAHSGKVGSALLQEKVRPVAGRVNNYIRSKIMKL